VPPADNDAVRLDLNNPEFQRTFFALEKDQITNVVGTVLRQYGRAARPAAEAGGQGPTPVAKRRLRWRQERRPELHAKGTGCD
jgi:hypothetical protein